MLCAAIQKSETTTSFFIGALQLENPFCGFWNLLRYSIHATEIRTRSELDLADDYTYNILGFTLLVATTLKLYAVTDFTMTVKTEMLARVKTRFSSFTGTDPFDGTAVMPQFGSLPTSIPGPRDALKKQAS